MTKIDILDKKIDRILFILNNDEETDSLGLVKTVDNHSKDIKLLQSFQEEVVSTLRWVKTGVGVIATSAVGGFMTYLFRIFG